MIVESNRFGRPLSNHHHNDMTSICTFAKLSMTHDLYVHVRMYVCKCVCV